MPKFRKKPVVIDAWQHLRTDDPDFTDMPEWLRERFIAGDLWFSGGEMPYFTVRTLEGEMRADVYDYIIKGVKGEIYPCKPSIFAATYEAV